MHLLKMCQKTWGGPSPLHLNKIQKNAFFSGNKLSLTFKNRWQHFWTWMSTQWTTSRPWKGSCCHSAQCTVQDDEALNSYNIYNKWINFKIINYNSWCTWYFIWPGSTTRCPLQFKVCVTPWNALEAGGRQMSRWGITWQAREKKEGDQKMSTWTNKQIKSE